MSPASWIFGAVIVAIFGSALLFGGRVPRAYRDRRCQGRTWRGAFPEASREDIRAFLSVFVSAFAFNDDQKLLLGPEDRVMHIYRALYPSRWQADALELETLASDLKRTYGLDLAAIWREDLSLGDIYLNAIQSRAAASDA